MDDALDHLRRVGWHVPTCRLCPTPPAWIARDGTPLCDAHAVAYFRPFWQGEE